MFSKIDFRAAATLTIGSNALDFEKNTLIRIERPPDTRGPALIELREGNMSLATGAEGPEPLPLVFAWNRVHLAGNENLRLEIADDRNFTQNTRSFETTENGLETVAEAGFWHWRISFEDEILTTGRFTVTDAAGPELVSPAGNSIYRFQSDLSQLRFQWSAKPEVSYYLLEISETPDFASPLVSREAAAVSFIYSSLGPETWYWRVLPVLFSVYEGTASYSAAASFRIERTDDPNAPALEIPKPAPVGAV